MIEGCRRNERLWQKQLYEYCFGEMMKVCLRYHRNEQEAGASFNNAMFKVFANIGQFRSDGEFMGWVRRIIVNTCLSALRQSSRFEARELDQVAETNAADPEIYQSLSAREILAMVQELDETHRLVFNLFVMEGYTHDEIAAQLGIAKGTSKWYLHEAKKQLKEKIKSLADYEISSDAI